jgi:hypothetical protein
MKSVVFFILILSCFAISSYPDTAEFYKEFRYRIEPAAKQQYNDNKTPPIKQEKASLIILESRNIPGGKTLGKGKWKKVSATAVYQASERHIERMFINLPKAWIENEYNVVLMPTADNRRYWWENDRTLHFYAVYRQAEAGF